MAEIRLFGLDNRPGHKSQSKADHLNRSRANEPAAEEAAFPATRPARKIQFHRIAPGFRRLRPKENRRGSEPTRSLYPAEGRSVDSS